MHAPDTASPETDLFWMGHALSLARMAWGETHPNPMVGAVVVHNNTVLSEAYHARAGELHAERLALLSLANQTRETLRQSTLYVTLEPCSSHGRTPPCTDIILASGIGRVVIGTLDPNPLHNGKAIAILRNHGIDVTVGVLDEECADLNLIFNHWIHKKTPFLVAKCATTLDGRIATRTGASRWITGEQSLADVMRWRRLFPAIAVGAGTVLSDNPVLTSRIPDKEPWCPVRIVFDRHLHTLESADQWHLYNDSWASRTVVVTTGRHPAHLFATIQAKGVRVWPFPMDMNGKFPWEAFRHRCAQESIYGVLIEGGSNLLSDLLGSGQADYLMAYRAPILFGDDHALPLFAGLAPSTPQQALRLTKVRHAILGEDQLLRGFMQPSACLDRMSR
ncbi:MAG: bifunctional diaminohydroxyphosphoribosylaminopyrimidine deaminase/5-amino-6-(5-phosphoribosylamino)uracil reductase RibD [Opitutales bacterium]|nr:bifunctional diaminohydroxyphosphoribosylaminopyrimidine deaminase/5-amino-6-(5-phosphoribosylamino)uracil reductase RibD [Opitutales bacterium]